MKITFRPIKNSDKPFLAKLYASTRYDELQPLPWSQEQKDEFLQFQFQAQHAHYMEHFPEAKFDLILKKNKPIGRLYLDYRDDEIRIVDIAIMPEYRNQGIGSQLLQDVMDDAKSKNLAVRIHVEQNNPAMRLYERLGYVKIEDQGVYWLMEWVSTEIPINE